MMEDGGWNPDSDREENGAAAKITFVMIIQQ